MSNVSHDFDPFKTDAGLKDDFDGTIVEGWWATDPQNRDPQALFGWLKIAADDGETVEPRYSTGTGWSSFDGGKTAEHEKDRERMRGFNNNTAYAQLFTKALECDGAGDELRRRNVQELGNIGPRAIDGLWKGLKFHWEVNTEKMTITDRDTKEPREITINRLLPTAFLGVAGAATSTPGPAAPTSPAPSGPQPPMAAPQPQAPQQPGPVAQPSQVQSPGPIPQPGAQPSPAPVATAPAPPAPPVEQAPSPAAEAPTAGPDWSFWTAIDPATQTAILAKSKETDYSHFVDEVLAMPGSTENAALITALGDEGLYNALRAM